MVCSKKYRRIQNITEYQNNLQRSFPDKGGPLSHGHNQIGDSNERTQKKCIFKIPKIEEEKNQSENKNSKHKQIKEHSVKIVWAELSCFKPEDTPL